MRADLYQFKRTTIAVVALLLSVSAQTASAFDEQRKGFILSFGGGAAFTDFDFDFSDSDADEDDFITGNDFNGALQLSLGVGFTNQFALTGTHIVSQASVEGERYRGFLLGATGTYWFSPTRPSVYVSATIGRLAVETNIPRFLSVDTATGDAARVAVGYEFANSLHLEVSYLYSESDNGFVSGGPILITESTQILANFVWY